MQTRLVDRQAELQFLEQQWRGRRSQLITVYGRRRVGKTEILKQFHANKRGVYYLADRRPERDQLRQVAERLGRFFEDDFVARKGFDDWVEAFEYVSSRVKKRFLWIIDEFPYLVDGNPATSSLFQKGWDEYLRDTPVFLVLCGSSITMMESEVLGQKAPLFGRRTGDLLVHPMPLDELRGFFPGRSYSQLVEIYAAVGGMPAYLLELEPKAPLERNVEKHVLRRGSFLFREVDFLLREELREPRNYLAILHALALGRRKFGDIINHTGLEKNVLYKYLQVLGDLRIVSREVSVTEPRPERSKRSLYKIDDPFTAFWMEYVYPFRSDLELGNTEPSLEHFRKSFFRNVSMAYETAARELLRTSAALPFPLRRLGRWWLRDEEIDLVGTNDERNAILFAEVKWSNKALGSNVYRALVEKSRKVEWGSDLRREAYALFSKSGFTAEMKRIAENDGVLLFHQDRLVGKS